MATKNSHVDTVEQIAQEIIQSFGERALAFAREQAEIVAELNDTISVQVWRDITDTIDRMQTSQRSKIAA
jgi:hypothetical protein